MSGHETFVVMTDGKPTTVIKTKSRESATNNFSSSSNHKLPFKFSGKSKEHIDQIEAKRLKTENALLLHKIQVLEKEIDFTKKPTDLRTSQRIESEEPKEIRSFDKETMTHLKSFSDAETQTFFLDLDSRTDVNCNNMTCLQCGSTINSNVDLVRLVDQANRNSASHQIMLRIESPKVFSPVSPSKSTPDDSSFGESLACLPCHVPAQQQVDETFQKLQEELVACKLREAESSLGFKELQQKVNQLGRQWQQFLKDSEHAKNSGDIKTRTLLELREAVMALKVRETCMVSDFNELKQKLIELETENNVSKRQAKRLQDEVDKLEEKLSEASLREDELVNETKDLQRNISNLNAKCQEDLIMFKIKDAEWCQTAAALRRKASELEIENHELVTALKLSNPKHSEMFEKIRSQGQNSLAKNKSHVEVDQDSTQPLDRLSDDFQQSVMELLSKCDMSDIMTESFIADTMFLQPSSLLVESQSVRRDPAPELQSSDLISDEHGDIANLQSVDCDSLERLNLE